MNRANAGSLLPQPSSVDFGAVSIGQTASTTVSLLNESSEPVEVTQLNLTGQSFSVVGPSNLPVTIAAGGTYTLNVQFNPAAAGTATGQLIVASNSSTSGTPVISLSGTGTTGAGSAALSALSCSSGAMTGSGTDACTVTLTTSAPSGGLIVNLSSSSSAVTVPSTVTVPAGAVSAGFTATVSSVATAQAVAMTASAGGVVKNFALQLNAAIFALSINATSVAFGDVVVNTSAIQPVTLTSTGILPVTINGATLTGAGFAVSGTAFPVTLNPSQEETLNIEFVPTAVGAATGQLTIASNSSANGTAVVGLSGIGTPAVAVTVTPSSVSLTIGTNLQFAASVTGTSNTAVTWTVSGTGCSGAACGTISSSGLYTAPTAVPSPASVTITATSGSGPTKSASAAVTIVPPAGTTYYLAPTSVGGNDSNNGLSPFAPWLTPNHIVNCGDVIMAAASTSYSSVNFGSGKWGKVTCATGNNVAWLKCAAFDTCKILATSLQGMWVDRSYWGIQGWEVSTSAADAGGTCFLAEPAWIDPNEIHHIIFANNVANGCGYTGFMTGNNGSSSVDYIAVVGNIAYNAAQGSLTCNNGIDIYEPVQSDALPGTHIYLAGNFSFGNFDPNPCANMPPGDGEGITLDTFDGVDTGMPFPYAAQAVVENNILVANGGRGLLVGDNGTGTPPFAQIYLRHNTMWGNNRDSNQTGGSSSRWCGEVDLLTTVNTEVFLNIAVTDAINGCGTKPIYAFYVIGTSTADSVYQNWGYAVSGTNDAIYSSPGFAYGPNNTFGTNPQFANAVAPSAPSCSGYANVPACMATVTANFTPTNAAAKGYGYQIPSNASVYDPLFPPWLCNVNLPSGLVTLGCETAP